MSRLCEIQCSLVTYVICCIKMYPFSFYTTFCTTLYLYESNKVSFTLFLNSNYFICVLWWKIKEKILLIWLKTKTTKNWTTRSHKTRYMYILWNTSAISIYTYVCTIYIRNMYATREIINASLCQVVSGEIQGKTPRVMQNKLSNCTI